MRKLYISFILSLLFILPACKRTQDITCTDPGVTLWMVGFGGTDLSGGLLYRYKQDNVFDSLIDSAGLSNVGQVRDTTLVANIIPGADYKLVLPATGKTYLITNMAQSGQMHKTFTYTSVPGAETFFHCYNNVISCTINGSVTTVFTIATDNKSESGDNRLYVQK